MKITAQGTVFSEQASSEEAFCCFPSVCLLSTGEILATFQCGPVKNHAHGTGYLSRSDDGGNSWSQPIRPFKDWGQSKGLTVHLVYLAEPTAGRIVANLMLCDHLGDAGLPFFNPKTGGALPLTIGLSESIDNGISWSEPRIIKTGRFDDVPAAIMSPIRKTSDGDWLIPFETSKSYNDAGLWDHYAACVVSKNEGQSWDQCVTVANDPKKHWLYWDQRLVAMDDNRCLAFFWTFDTRLGADSTVHRSVSVDGGQTWPRTPENTGLVGQSTWPVPLDGDKVVALTVDRYGEGVIKACLSDDLGKTWLEELVLHKHELSGVHADNLVGNLSEMQLWSFGLPSGIRTGEKEILAVWYCGAPENTSIEWAKIKV